MGYLKDVSESIMRVSGTGRANMNMSKRHESDRFVEYQQTLDMQTVTLEQVVTTSVFALEYFAVRQSIDFSVSDHARDTPWNLCSRGDIDAR